MPFGGLSDFLVLLSVYQTCKYRGVSFLKFLLSREDDLESYYLGVKEAHSRSSGILDTRVLKVTADMLRQLN